MSLDNLKPDIVSGMLLSRLNDAMVFAKVSNTDYQGEITSYGQSVRINQIDAVTINTYTPGTTADLTIEQITTAAQVLLINQARAYAFTIEDADNAKARAKVLNEGITEAAFGLANSVDAYIAGLHAGAGVAVGGTAVAGVDITSTNVAAYFNEAQYKLDETNTPQVGRWAVLPPWLSAKIGMMGIVQKTDNGAVFASGSIGRLMGFDIYPSNQISAISTTDRYPCLFGYRGSISMATQLIKTAIVEPSKQFVTLAKGLLVFGAKVTRANNLGVLYADYTAEAT